MAEGLIVVARLGVSYAEPPGLYDALADHFDANHHDPKDVREDLFGYDIPRNGRTSAEVDTEMLRLTALSLLKGVSVIHDAFMNRPDKRGWFLKVAESIGATTVLIHPTAEFTDIRDRVHASVNESDSPDEEKKLKVVEKMRVVHNLWRYTQRSDIDPDRNPKVEHLCIDGMLSVEEVIPQIDDYIAGLRQTQQA